MRKSTLFLLLPLALLALVFAPAAFAGDCEAPAAPGVDWSDCDFSTNAPFLAGTLGADLSNADLSNANLSGATFYRLDMNGAHVSGANFGSASFSNVNINSAQLGGADFNGAVLAIVDFTGSSGSPANIAQAATFENVICPDGTSATVGTDCGWVPTAVGLNSFGAAPGATIAPAAPLLLLLLAAAALWLSRRRAVL